MYKTERCLKDSEKEIDIFMWTCAPERELERLNFFNHLSSSLSGAHVHMFTPHNQRTKFLYGDCRFVAIVNQHNPPPHNYTHTNLVPTVYQAHVLGSRSRTKGQGRQCIVCCCSWVKLKKKTFSWKAYHCRLVIRITIYMWTLFIFSSFLRLNSRNSKTK